MIRTSPEQIRKTIVSTCRSAWRKLERSDCKLEERFENARAKRMQAEETANAPALVEETPLYAQYSRRTTFYQLLKPNTVELEKGITSRPEH